MSIRISNLRLALDEPEAELGTRVVRLLGIAPEAVKRWRILRKSLDGRDKNLLRFVYSIEMELEEDEMRLARIAQRRAAREVRIEPYCESPFSIPAPGQRPLAHR